MTRGNSSWTYSPSSQAVEQSSATTLLPPSSDPLNVVGGVGGVVISLMIVVGVVGNVLVLTAIVRCAQLRRSYNAFIASLSVTDLVFNVAVMPFYVDTFVRRRWRFTDAVCRWHTYFGTTVIVSSSLHIVLIAVSRYHLIVRPRFYARWLASRRVVAAQIVVAWLCAAAMTLPGIVGALPAVIRYSDQLSRCSYDRNASYGSLAIIFCAGFIVPCVVVAYCYGMIWRRMREVGQRVDGYSSHKLTKMRQHQQQNGQSVFESHWPPSAAAAVGEAASVNAPVRSEPPPSADENQHLTTENERYVDVDGPRPGQSSDVGGHTDCGHVDHQDDLEQVAAVDHPRLHVISVDVTSSGRRTDRASCPRCNDDVDDNDDNDQLDVDDGCQNRHRSNSSGSHQLTTAPSSRPSVSTRTSQDDVREERAEATSVDNVRPTGVDVDVLDRLQPAAESQTPKHDNIRVVITPAATPSRGAAVDVRRASSTVVLAPDVTGTDRRTAGDQLDRPARDDDGHLSVEHGRRRPPHSLRLLRHHEVGGGVERSYSPVPSTCQRHRSHSLHMIVAVFLAFVLTYLPFTVTNLADLRARLDRNVYMLTSLAFWAGSCVNPLIYGIMNVQFRRAYVAIVVTCWRRAAVRCRHAPP